MAYFTWGALCLAAAFAIIAWRPASIAGFYYHPRLVTVVHLVTLGWISGSILGALYLVAPMALRTPLPSLALDRWACAAFIIGTAGTVSHFWIEEPWGVASAGFLVWLAFLRMTYRILRELRRAPVPIEIRLHFVLALVNILLAGGLGLSIALDKRLDLLPGFVLDHVFAHAHLAALGWATMMVMAAGYRLLPMLLPAAMPQGAAVWGTAIAMQVGVLGLSAGLFLKAPWTPAFGLVVVLAILLFFGRVAWMLRHRRRPPAALRRPDFGVLHAVSALICLALAAILGIALLLRPDAPWRIAAAMTYGALGLVGFLSQMIVGVANRLLPLFSWLQAFAGSGFRRQPPSPHEVSSRALQRLVFGLWSVGVPSLAIGLGRSHLELLRWGAVALLLAVLANLAQQRRVLRVISATAARPESERSSSGDAGAPVSNRGIMRSERHCRSHRGTAVGLSLLVLAAPGARAFELPPPTLASLVGERLEFRLRWGAIPAARAALEVVAADAGRVRLRATARTLAYLDLIYPVRDEVESTVWPQGPRVVHYRKQAKEGRGPSSREEIVFRLDAGLAYYRRGDEAPRALEVPAGVQDPLSCLYAYRTMPVMEDRLVQLPISDGKKLITGRIGVVGREVVETPAGRFSTVVIEPRIEHLGGLFKKSPGARVLIWLTDDAWRRPVKLQSEVSIGRFTAELATLSHAAVASPTEPDAGE